MIETQQSTALKASRAAIGIALSGVLVLGMVPLAPQQAYADEDATAAEEPTATEESTVAEEAPVAEEAATVEEPSTEEVEGFEGQDESASYDRAAIWAAGVDDASLVEEIYPESQGQNARARAATPSVEPMTFSDEMLYFCKYESSCNYDQGLSSGDGYNAMGYFQFDRRYGLGNFLQSVYNYNPTRYKCLKVIGDKYNWNTNRATRSNGKFTTFGNDLNTAWHAAYKANPTEFSRLQNGWAYDQYYDGASGVRGSLKAFGIDIDKRADCVKGLVWGMSNLFGQGGGASYVNQGLYYGCNWFFKEAKISNSMTDAQLVTALCDTVVNKVATRYPSQPEYHQGWQNRYKSEKADCLKYLQDTEEGKEEALDSLASKNKSVLANGTYLIRSSLSQSQVLDVKAASKANKANVQTYTSNMSKAQQWKVTHDSKGYVTFTNVNSGKALDVKGGAAKKGTNVQQYSSNGSRAQKWIVTKNSNGSYRIVSALNSSYSLEIQSSVTSNGANVQINSGSSTGGRAFYFIDTTPSVAKCDDAMPTGAIVIQSALDSSYVVDVKSGSIANGANVQLYRSNGSQAQMYTLKYSNGYYRIVNAKSGKGLDVEGGNLVNGTNVQQWSGSLSSNNQLFSTVKNSDGTYSFVSKSTGLALDVKSAKAANSSNIQVYAANGSKAQSFNVVAVGALGKGTYSIRSASNSNYAVDVKAASAKDGANIQLYKNNGTAAQQWSVVKNWDGTYTIKNVNSGKVLDVKSGKAQSGANVQQYSNNGSKAQKWYVQYVDGGEYRIVSALNNSLVLEMDGSNAANSVNIRIATDTGKSNQRFSFFAS